MKKLIFIIPTLLLTFMFIPNVKADTVIYTVKNTKERTEALNVAINKSYEIINSYEYNYYLMAINPTNSDYIRLYLMNNNNYSLSIGFSSSGTPAISVNQHRDYECIIYNDGTTNCVDYSDTEGNNYLEYFLFDNTYNLYDTNIDFKANTDFEIKGIYDDNIVISNNSSIPTIKNLLNYDSWADYESNNNPNYTEVNLNNYAYIALFLKDYSNTTAFSSTTYVKGQSCITPVYNFSTSLKPTGSQNICSSVYSDYTVSDIYILESDIKNNAVYYVSAYDKSIENYIKIDNTIFDIQYVSEEAANNPTFSYNGSEYNGIGLSDIDYSANNNTDNGLIPGESSNIAEPFENVFNKPLELFKSIASAISSFFGLITSFLGFLPAELQIFVYFAFVIAIVLGIIKIIL